MKETTLFKPIKKHFADLGYEVFSEVIVPFSGGRVDVVAHASPAAVAVEMKTSLSIDLIQQAVERQAVFPYVYVAIPYRKQPIAHWLRMYLREQGIGLLEVKQTDSFFGAGVEIVMTTLRASYRRPPMKLDFSKILLPEHKTWLEGGSAGGGYVTPYKLTMAGVRNYLYRAQQTEEEGWRTVAEILEHCETHYGTPKSSLAKALLEFESNWCEVRKHEGRLWFRHKQEVPHAAP